MKMKKLVRAAGAGITAAVVALSLTVSGIRSEAAPSYLKAATYVSDAWVSNFWNSESDHMDEELAQIAADGFNSIVLVVPWREFQPGVLPVSYNRYAFQKLDKVMNAANAHGLMVELRVGYVWDYYNDDVTTGRFRDLLKDPSTRCMAGICKADLPDRISALQFLWRIHDLGGFLELCGGRGESGKGCQQPECC